VTVEHAHGQQAIVLRRPPRGVKAGIAHDMGREHGILTALHARGVPVPKPLARCDDAAVIGAPFYLMEHVNGVILRGSLPASFTGDAAAMPGTLAGLSRTFVQTLAQLHAVDVSVEPLASLGRPDGYVQRQVQGWTKRWLASRTDDVAELDWIATWLDAHRPPDGAPTLVHNDFKLDNLVLEPDLSRVRAILDWEMATIGDPLMDLGTSLAYWVEAGDAPIFRALGLGITALPGNMTRAELVQAYGAHRGIDVSDAPFYYTFGLFKVAVIAQQIYARHVEGLTSDPRFAVLGEVVKALGIAAQQAAERGRV
jgi:aminoglycoside phosphotransferase (APT) family kinase protein